ncbi:MAG TPA: Uma2 family endonuclease [Thermomicrobiales bacterium]|nr:Uma2 family endonuclease [Thermomicrobiales bacterium]
MIVSEIELQMRSTDASWGYEKWERLPDDGNRYEVIDGVLYMSTAPSFWHQQSVGLLHEYVGIPLRRSGFALVAMAPVGVIMPGADPVQPDFVLIRSERRNIVAEDGRIRGVPDLIAEVLSPSHPELDMVVKRAAYARAGVPEYWILRPETRDVLMYSDPDGALADFTSLQRFSVDNELVSPTLPIRVAVTTLFEDASPPAE